MKERRGREIGMNGSPDSVKEYLEAIENDFSRRLLQRVSCKQYESLQEVDWKIG